MIKDRYLHKDILRDLKEKMVFIGGPRQVGKTTLAKYVGDKDFNRVSYLNWDSREDRQDILAGRFRSGADLVIFDELHKYRQWKNYLKGEFDKYKDKFKVLVTGSARLDLYRRGGDSLMGRYHYYRLHPFSLAEAVNVTKKQIKEFEMLPEVETTASTRKAFADLMTFGGFPEPFLKKDRRALRRFHNERLDRLVRGDIRDIESIRDLSGLQILVDLLPDKVGSLLSLNSLKVDLQVTHKTVSLWVEVLESFYYHFRIYPYTAKTIKSLRKEPKLYLWDWSQVADRSARFENIIASHLLKLVHYLYDAEGIKAELYFLRDIAGRETDFIVTIDRKPWFIVEAKTKAKELDKSLLYFLRKIKAPFAYQVVLEPGIDFEQKGVRVISADAFLAGLI